MPSTGKQKKSEPRAGALPPGTPAWITPELVRETIRVWQPFYTTPLTLDDAVNILDSAGRLFGVLLQDGCHEKVSRLRSGQQP